MNEGKKPKPKGWGKDALSEFIEISRENDHATFARMPDEYGVLVKVDTCFSRITENLTNNERLVCSVLLLRCHSSYRAACRLAISGQVTEGFPVLRSCLETSMYCLHIAKNPGTDEIWLRRHENVDSIKKCKSEFKVANVMRTWEKEDPSMASIARGLYERTIDFGGHPNEKSVTSGLIIEETERATTFWSLYLSGNPLHIAHAMKTCAQIGLAALYATRLVFRERFDILDITDELDELKRIL